jgi:hypothetical protein
MKRWKFPAAVTLVIAAVSLAACGGSSPSTAGVSPTAPTSPSTPAAVTGATITGTVQGLAGTSAAVGARDVITVTVAGTTISATVDSQGTFVLNGVPAGTVTLTFSGTSATVTLQNVGQSGRIKIVIVVSGSTATVETEQRVATDGQAQLEGRLSPLGLASGTGGSFSVGDVVVTAPPDTIRQGDSTVVNFATLKVGDRVHVAGTVTGTNAMSASLVTVQSTNPNVPVNLKGAISTPVISGCPAAAEFVVEGWKVKTFGTTDFRKGSCTDLKVGVEVHVKGDVKPAAGAVPAYVQAEWVQFGK